MKVIVLETRGVYGQSKAYPTCEIGRAICELAGTKTVTAGMLPAIKALGFQVRCVPQAVPAW